LSTTTVGMGVFVAETGFVVGVAVGDDEPVPLHMQPF